VKTSSIGRRYARALIELADEQKKTSEVQKGLTDFAEAWASSSELRDVFANPAVGMEQRKAVLEAVGTKMGLTPLLLNTLRLLSDRSRMVAVPDLAEAFQEMAEAREGYVRVEVTTATTMSDDYFAKLIEILETVATRKPILVKKQDPSLIAGVVTRVGDQVFDGSLRSHLNELKEELLSK